MAKTPDDLKKLAKFMEYLLGRRPDEFGLLPDHEGFVKIKTLLQALQGDPEWGHLRHAHLKTLFAAERPAVIEIQDDRVRACIRNHLPAITEPTAMPRQLYTAIRRRAYRVVHSKGIRPSVEPFVMLSADVALAEKIGRRSDNAPVILTVLVARSQAAGTQYKQLGDRLFLADFIPAETFSGPPLPKEKPVEAPSPPEARTPKTPGSYFPDWVDDRTRPGEHKGRRPRRDEADWKKERRHARRHKYLQND